MNLCPRQVRSKCNSVITPILFSALITLLASVFAHQTNQEDEEESQQQARSKPPTSPIVALDVDASINDLQLSCGIDQTNQQQQFVSDPNASNGWVLKSRAHSVSYINSRQPPIRHDCDKSTTINPPCVWPEQNCRGDRIIDQLRLADSLPARQVGRGKGKIKIYPPDLSHPPGEKQFETDKCAQQVVDRCSITHEAEEADAIIMRNSDVPPAIDAKKRRQDQIWIAYLLESPVHTFDRRLTRAHRGKHEFNWTATYRSDSDVVTPYAKFVPFDLNLNEYLRLKDRVLKVNDSDGDHYAKSTSAQHMEEMREVYERSSKHHKDLIRGKSGKVAWFASNCHVSNGRLELARELSSFIQVDVYGRCGNLTCDKRNHTGCMEMLNLNYKFYLSFENSNCRQYITEKLYHNAYGMNDQNHLIVPIVMGAPKEDYNDLVPHYSSIHVDDFASVKDLADYLKLLDSDDSLYYSYFHWKTMGRFIDTQFMCRICALVYHSLESGKPPKSYGSLKDWWNSYPQADSTTNSDSCE